MDQLQLDMGCNIKSDKQLIEDAIALKIGDEGFQKYLVVATNKDGSFSIKAKTFLAAKVNIRNKNSYIEFKTKNADVFQGYTIVQGTNDFSRIMISGVQDALSFAGELSVLYMTVLFELGGERFGCCHRYTQCSDALKCTHPNLMVSLACAYKGNLESGKVFYGKNKNI